MLPIPTFENRDGGVDLGTASITWSMSLGSGLPEIRTIVNEVKALQAIVQSWR